MAGVAAAAARRTSVTSRRGASGRELLPTVAGNCFSSRAEISLPRVYRRCALDAPITPTLIARDIDDRAVVSSSLPWISLASTRARAIDAIFHRRQGQKSMCMCSPGWKFQWNTGMLIGGCPRVEAATGGPFGEASAIPFVSAPTVA